MIANEVLTNTYKYAFGPSNSTPQLKIEMENETEEFIISFSDNGAGFDPKKKHEGNRT
ncbi:sensor histidine kinase [Brumimicrobium aurantiacum]|uniref:sensor histidine kinase n=1 Tax=Brumimicrobium aurantiacum TaxID=1737063 RepID=UPI001401FD01|nr:sensor histidine kinase [Brumimicrobium aurantiacum]